MPELLTVNRQNVFTVATRYLDTNSSVPSLTLIRGEFETPTSPSIAVYFSEWRTENADLIADIKRTPAQLKAKCERLDEAIKTLGLRVGELEKELFDFKDWLAGNHPYILTEWENYGANAE